jgi:DNA-binding IscR family transcriptional regulator
MQQVRDAIADILDNYTLARLIGEVQKRRHTKTAAFHFDI